MGRNRDVGVARVPRQPDRADAGERQVAIARVPRDVGPTGLLPDYRKIAPPVFADDTGTRRRLIGWAVFGIAVLGLILIGLLWLSQTTSAVSPG